MKKYLIISVLCWTQINKEKFMKKIIFILINILCSSVFAYNGPTCSSGLPGKTVWHRNGVAKTDSCLEILKESQYQEMLTGCRINSAGDVGYKPSGLEYIGPDLYKVLANGQQETEYLTWEEANAQLNSLKRQGACRAFEEKKSAAVALAPTTFDESIKFNVCVATCITDDGRQSTGYKTHAVRGVGEDAFEALSGKCKGQLADEASIKVVGYGNSFTGAWQSWIKNFKKPEIAKACSEKHLGQLGLKTRAANGYQGLSCNTFKEDYNLLVAYRAKLKDSHREAELSNTSELFRRYLQVNERKNCGLAHQSGDSSDTNGGRQ